MLTDSDIREIRIQTGYKIIKLFDSIWNNSIERKITVYKPSFVFLSSKGYICSMYTLDRSAFKMQTHEQASDNCEYWLGKTISERLLAAAYLNSVAYNFPLNSPPALDRACFKITRR